MFWDGTRWIDDRPKPTTTPPARVRRGHPAVASPSPGGPRRPGDRRVARRAVLIGADGRPVRRELVLARRDGYRGCRWPAQRERPGPSRPRVDPADLGRLGGRHADSIVRNPSGGFRVSFKVPQTPVGKHTSGVQMAPGTTRRTTQAATQTASASSDPTLATDTTLARAIFRRDSSRQRDARPR